MFVEKKSRRKLSECEFNGFVKMYKLVYRKFRKDCSLVQIEE